MEIKIGIQHVNREVVLESNEGSDDILEKVRDAIIDHDGVGVLTLTDERGRKVVVPAAAIGYVDIGEESTRRVGFGAV